MSKPSLISIFPDVRDLLAVEPGDLGAVILEVAPYQNGRFEMGGLLAQVFPPAGRGPCYPIGHERAVMQAFAEALAWLVTQGLLAYDHSVVGLYYIATRRSRAINNRADFDTYLKGRMLPTELLPPILVEKAWPLFQRGDHDVAVFQAMKVVEVVVRDASNVAGAEYPNDLVGTKLMRRAFDPERGPLRDDELVVAERESEAHLFAGAIGHAKNPVSHTDVQISPTDAARLIVLAGYLLGLLARRFEKLGITLYRME